MKKLKFSIISISVLLSFGLIANEQDVSLYESAKQEEKKVIKNSSKKRSQLRNDASLTELENQVLDEEIVKLQKQLAIKKLQFTLGNIPPEYLDRVEDYLQKEYFTEDVHPNTLYPSLREKTESFRTFPQESYDIDQVIAVPKSIKNFSKEDNMNNNTTPVVTYQKPAVVYQENTDVIVVDESNTTTPVVENSLPQDDEVDFGDLDVDSPALENVTPEEFEDVKGMLTDEELARITSLENDNSEVVLVTGQDEDDLKAKAKLEVQKVFSKIENAVIDSVFIFGDDKSVDLKMTFYVGDGGEGEQLNNTLREVKENQVISVRGFKYKIKNISFKEVEIENLEDNSIFVASKSLREAR